MSLPRVLIIGEGPSEIGDLDAPNGIGKRRRSRSEGYIAPMLRRLLGSPVEIRAQKITSLGKRGTLRGPPGHGDRAAKALALASADGCALLVFVKDVDRAPGVKKSPLERKRKLAELNMQIDAGFATVRGAESVLRAKATPCRMIEAWALGDSKALSPLTVSRGLLKDVPAQPEALWGDETDATSSHPKCVLRRVLGGEANKEVFHQLGSTARPDTLRKSCPESFAPFADEVARAAEGLRRIPQKTPR